MRWALAMLLAVAASGCLADEGQVRPLVCPADGGGVQARFGLLLAREVPDEAKPTQERARFLVQVLEGQGLSAEAAWEAEGGSGRAWLHGPGLDVVGESSPFAWSGPVAPGVYEIEVEGTPFLFGAEVSLILQATGCPPATDG